MSKKFVYQVGNYLPPFMRLTINSSKSFLRGERFDACLYNRGKMENIFRDMPAKAQRRMVRTIANIRRNLHGERGLLAAIIAQSLVDAMSKDTQLAADGWLWLHSEDCRVCLEKLGFGDLAGQPLDGVKQLVAQIGVEERIRC